VDTQGAAPASYPLTPTCYHSTNAETAAQEEAEMADEQEREGPVLTFSDLARQRVRAVLDQQKIHGDGGVRISIPGRGSGGWEHKMSLVQDGQGKPDDTVLDAGLFKVYIDPQTVPILHGARVEFLEQGSGGGFQIENPNPAWDSPLAVGIQELIDTRVNPNVASHGGFVELIDVANDTVYLRLGGGCQGCGMVDVTLRQGIEVLIKQAYPQIREVVDTTDHAGGSNPYYQPAKGGEPQDSPMYQSAKG
jgi:Fe/S biogenesis protein NfuA